MAKVQIKELLNEYLTDFLEENGLELYNSEFRKEGKNRCLRIHIDKKDFGRKRDVACGTETEYVSTGDCEKVSRFLSECLDRDDPISQNYILEVSSPGLDRQLFKPADYERFEGSVVDVKLYRNHDGRKEFRGILRGLRAGHVEIETDDGEIYRFKVEDVAKTSLAVIF